MKRSSTFLLLLVVIVLIVAYYLIKPTQSSEQSYEKPDIDITFDIAKLTKIEIDHSGQYIRLEKIRDRWKIIDPINAYADDEAVYNLMEGLAKFKLTGKISSSSAKHAMYEVDSKGTNVTISSADGKSTTLVVGKNSSTSGQAYIRPTSSDNVYTAKGLVPGTVNKTVSEWRQRTVYRVEPRQMKMITIRSGDGRVVLKRDDKRWMMNGSLVSAKLMKPAVDELSSLRAEGFIDTVVMMPNAPSLHVELMADELIRMDFYRSSNYKNQYLLKSSTDPKLFAVKASDVEDIHRLVSALTGGGGEEFSEEPAGGSETTEPAMDDSYKPPAGTQNSEISPQAQQVLQQILRQSTNSNSQTGLAASNGIEDNGELTVYTVKAGETVASIANKFKVTEEQLRKWNILKPTDTVKPGMELYIYQLK